MLPKIEPVITAQELLVCNEDAVIAFMNKSHTKARRFDISQIANVDRLSPAELEKLSQKLENAAGKVNPLPAGTLHQLLSSLQQRLAQDEDRESRPQDRRDKSQTASPPPTEENAKHWQAFAHDKLTQAGVRPVIPLRELRPISKMTKQSVEKAALFVDLPKKPPDDYVPPVFTSQLEHWNSFKQQWQWWNRGKAGREEGFAAFLASMKEEYLATGEEQMVTDEVSFERMVRRKWEYEQPGMEVSNRESFAAYARAVEIRLASHHFNFTQPFQLLEDPRQQDQWTTRVEYLNFIYWQGDGDITAMENAGPRYRRAMEELLQLGEEQPAPATKKGTLQQQLNATREGLTEKCERINKICQDSAPYLKCQAGVRRHQLRAQWILEQRPLMERKDAAGTNGSGIQGSEIKNPPETVTNKVANTRKQMKRKCRHDEDDDHPADGINSQSPLKRSRRQASTTSNSASALALDGRLDGRGGANALMSSGGEVAAPVAKADTKLRRSQRHQIGCEGASGNTVADKQPADTGGAGVRRIRRRR